MNEEYNGHERRRSDAIINELDKRFIRVEISLKALQDRTEYIHKRNKELDDRISDRLKAFEILYWGDGNGMRGIASRVQHMEDKFEVIITKIKDSTASNMKMFVTLFTVALGILIKLFLN